MEPVAYQWAQQGVRVWLEQKLKAGVLQDYVTLEDQGRNQRFAALGSMSQMYDTLDLSSASDSVKWDVIRRGFPTPLVKHLFATRSTKVLLPDGTIVKPDKFAPMGSALCFPVQTVLYSSVILMLGVAKAYNLDWKVPGAFEGIDVAAAVKMAFYRRHSPDRAFGFQPFCTYGDDIIVDEALTSNVIDCLSLLGFKVNTEKSFTGAHPYRESCGEHYCNGERVTPLAFKPKEIKSEVDLNSVVGIIDLINRCPDYGYENLRRTLIQFVMRYPIAGVRQRNGVIPILFTEDPEVSSAILHHTPRNTHLAKSTRFKPRKGSLSKDLQRVEYKRIYLGPVAKDNLEEGTNPPEVYRYSLWWRSRYGSEAQAPSHEPQARIQIKRDPEIILRGPDAFYASLGLGPDQRSDLIRLMNWQSSRGFLDIPEAGAAVDTLRTGVCWGWTPSR
jgi:hypothetical protein